MTPPHVVYYLFNRFHVTHSNGILLWMTSGDVDISQTALEPWTANILLFKCMATACEHAPHDFSNFQKDISTRDTGTAKVGSLNWVHKSFYL